MEIVHGQVYKLLNEYYVVVENGNHYQLVDTENDVLWEDKLYTNDELYKELYINKFIYVCNTLQEFKRA